MSASIHPVNSCPKIRLHSTSQPLLGGETLFLPSSEWIRASQGMSLKTGPTTSIVQCETSLHWSFAQVVRCESSNHWSFKTESSMWKCMSLKFWAVIDVSNQKFKVKVHVIEVLNRKFNVKVHVIQALNQKSNVKVQCSCSDMAAAHKSAYQSWLQVQHLRIVLRKLSSSEASTSLELSIPLHCKHPNKTCSDGWEKRDVRISLQSMSVTIDIYSLFSAFSRCRLYQPPGTAVAAGC